MKCEVVGAEAKQRVLALMARHNPLGTDLTCATHVPVLNDGQLHQFLEDPDYEAVIVSMESPPEDIGLMVYCLEEGQQRGRIPWMSGIPGQEAAVVEAVVAWLKTDRPGMRFYGIVGNEQLRRIYAALPDVVVGTDYSPMEVVLGT